MKYLLIGASALAMAACGQETEPPAIPSEIAVEEAEVEAVDTADMAGAEEALDAVLAAQSEETKARYQYRHPKETLMFFGIEPGMTVVEALPGGGWYTKILLPYLGEEGRLIGVDYSIDMWPLFGGFATPEYIEERKGWAEDWPGQTAEWEIIDGAEVDAATFGAMPEGLAGGADAVLFIRALHNVARFNDEGGFFDAAIADAMMVLKPGGVVGVVQHRAPADISDEWAVGDSGYLKQSRVISAFEAGGFELVDTSEINANPKDQPTEEDMVWRLPPSLGTSSEDAALRADMMAIGESDRMTLLFRKPE